MPGRKFNPTAYSYGMNGQEKDDNEIFEGAYTAEFWEYDSRLGRRWNVDPAFKQKPWMAPYHGFSNKPIQNIDPNGANDDEVNAVYNEKTKEYDRTKISDNYGPNVIVTHFKGGALDGQHQVFSGGKAKWFGGNNSSSTSSASKAASTAVTTIGAVDQIYGVMQNGKNFDNYVTLKGKTKPIFTAKGTVRSATAQQQLNWNNGVKGTGLGLNVLSTTLGAWQVYDQYQQGGVNNIDVVDATGVTIGTVGTVANGMSYLGYGGAAATSTGYVTGIGGLFIATGQMWWLFYGKPLQEFQKFNTPTTNNPDEAEWNQKMNSLGCFNENDLYGGN